MLSRAISNSLQTLISSENLDKIAFRSKSPKTRGRNP